MTSSALTAAASRYVDRKVTRGAAHKATTADARQGLAWQMYHATPGARFAATYMANGMSGATLYAGRRADDGAIEPAPDNHRAAEIVQQIADGPDGQSKLLGAFGKHLTVPGEGWIVVRPNGEILNPLAPEDGHDWRVLSTTCLGPHPASQNDTTPSSVQHQRRPLRGSPTGSQHTA
ncbi:hypothetical protein [Streptomyces mutabilis]|uniref:hypothetical protein n=1 Tax=Streptomyces mutabilis TaxID=67332 RepID=UPI003413049B